MTQTKKLVYGGQRGLDTAIAKHKERGWIVVSTETVQRGSADNRPIYIAHLRRDKK